VQWAAKINQQSLLVRADVQRFDIEPTAGFDIPYLGCRSQHRLFSSSTTRNRPSGNCCIADGS